MIEDIAIVGAGPAGAYLGYLLGQRGISAVIYDDSHPREKPCGGGITPSALEKFPLLRDIPSSYRYVDKILSDKGYQLVAPAETVARAYAGVAGLLNALCIFDAVVLAAMGVFGEPTGQMPRRRKDERERKSA